MAGMSRQIEPPQALKRGDVIYVQGFDGVTRPGRVLDPAIDGEGHGRVQLLPSDRCADCGGPIGQDNGPPDGWQLEDGRTVCQACCAADTRQLLRGSP